MLVFMLACQADRSSSRVDDLAANAEVAEFMQRFEGRGQQSDFTKLPSPAQLLKDFMVAEDITVELVLSEPDIVQPVELNFDHRGRLWVVQYSQYPYPDGVKVTGIDHHIRMQFDKKPLPPPAGVRGADKISFFEDTDGDGIFDHKVDAITGLNIATAVTWGRGKIWVLNPPYLLAYPDADDNGIPDGDPRVCIDGFGLEDTHAVANSLRWGPDGWLYGATGSTTHSNINTSVSKNIRFEGQAIWRYHPRTEVFEIFAEGGGNTFHVEIDAKGRIYSGTNGTSRGQYYKQGSYYTKNWGKHGPHTNPYSFGHLSDMKFSGQAMRFTHAWIKYEGHSLPQRYHEKIIAINPLQNFLLACGIDPQGSSFATRDEFKVLASNDRWFRPVDIKAGPEGAVYIADWSDSRLSHVNPRDDWHKESGRIFRLRSKQAIPFESFDYSALSLEDLVAKLQHPNKWHRQQAVRQMGDRADPNMGVLLLPLLQAGDAQVALEALWGLYQIGAFTKEVAKVGFTHTDPFVRMWAVRLAVDEDLVNEDLGTMLHHLALHESNPEVIAQLLASSQRMRPHYAFPLLKNIVPRLQLTDPDHGLMYWWGLEEHTESNHQAVLDMFRKREFWNIPVIREIVLERLVQKSMQVGGKADFHLVKQLFELAPDQNIRQKLIKGFLNSGVTTYPESLNQLLEKYLGNSEINKITWRIQNQDPEAISAALVILEDNERTLSERTEIAAALGKAKIAGAKDALIEIMANRNAAEALTETTLKALVNFDDVHTGERIVSAYPDHLRANVRTRNIALQVLVSRPSWAMLLQNALQHTRAIHQQDLSKSLLTKLAWVLGDSLKLRAQDHDMRDRQMDRVQRLAESNQGNPEMGEKIYGALCGSCHQLHGLGGMLGPDLTGYDRQNPSYLTAHIVDPDLDVREGYVNFGIRTHDDRYFMGLVQDRSTKQVRLQSESGWSETFNLANAKVLQPLPGSLMPDNLLTDLPDEQVADLFSYLRQEK